MGTEEIDWDKALSDIPLKPCTEPPSSPAAPSGKKDDGPSSAKKAELPSAALADVTEPQPEVEKARTPRKRKTKYKAPVSPMSSASVSSEPKKVSKKPKKGGKKETKAKAVGKAKPKKTKVKVKAKKLSDAEALESVFLYLKHQNRPFNAVKIFENLEKIYSQKQVKAVLEELVGAEKVCEKSGSGIFWVSQGVLETEIEKGLKGDELETELVAVKGTKEVLQQRQAELMRQIRTIKQEPNPEELETLLVEHREKVKKLKALFQKVSSQQEPAAQTQKDVKAAEIGSSEELEVFDVKRLQLETKFHLKTWKERKQNVVEAVAGISEAGGTALVSLFEEIGLDQDAGYELRKVPKTIAELQQTQ